MPVMRGDLVTISLQGDFGKSRPALVIQADQFHALASVTVLPITSTLVPAPLLRITLEPSIQNGLQKPSQIMIDKTVTLKRDKVGNVFGQIDASVLVAVERSLAVFLGIAK
jgi:mRNA interferase MazF